jgi:hypothetical protein
MDLFSNFSDLILVTLGLKPNAGLVVIIAVILYVIVTLLKQFPFYGSISKYIPLVDAGTGSIAAFIILLVQGNEITFSILSGLATGFSSAAACVLGYEGIQKLVNSLKKPEQEPVKEVK